MIVATRGNKKKGGIKQDSKWDFIAPGCLYTQKNRLPKTNNIFEGQFSSGVPCYGWASYYLWHNLKLYVPSCRLQKLHRNARVSIMKHPSIPYCSDVPRGFRRGAHDAERSVQQFQSVASSLLCTMCLLLCNNQIGSSRQAASTGTHFFLHQNRHVQTSYCYHCELTP